MRALALEKYKLNNLTLESDSEALNRGDQRNQRIVVDCGDRFRFGHGRRPLWRGVSRGERVSIAATNCVFLCVTYGVRSV